MQGSVVTRTLDWLPGLVGVMRVKTGGAYSVTARPGDGPGGRTLGLGSGRLGRYTRTGLEAAADYGVDLARTIVVPGPGEHWLRVTAGLVDVVLGGC